MKQTHWKQTALISCGGNTQPIVGDCSKLDKFQKMKTFSTPVNATKVYYLQYTANNLILISLNTYALSHL